MDQLPELVRGLIYFFLFPLILVLFVFWCIICASGLNWILNKLFPK